MNPTLASRITSLSLWTQVHVPVQTQIKMPTRTLSLSLLSLPLFLTMVTGCKGLELAPKREPQDARTFVPVAPAAPSASGSGVLLGYEFIGGKDIVGPGGCRLRVENLNTKKDQFLTLKADALGVFAPLDPGLYTTRRIGCGVSRVWNIDDLFAEGFRVEPGKVSYIGKVYFMFSQGEMNSVRKGTRLESAESLSATLGLLSKGGREALISGFTGRPLTREMIEGERREGFDVFAQGTARAQDLLEPLLARLKRCGTEAAQQDPLRFGQLEIVASYRQGKFVDFPSRRETDALSADFKSCIDASLREFQPSAGSDLQVRVRF